ncbi:MAG: hypothetical protein RBU28_05050 [Bacteroidales bacterium]|jgi:flagellar biosynthesis/type III secretory pathway M-ring protein FliF/YscJ|nr:hypothetical protein [Bacteroidales bacterium]
MILLIRVILIGVIFYLILKPVFKFFEGEEEHRDRRPQQPEKKKAKKGVPKELGEYVDYEEVD